MTNQVAPMKSAVSGHHSLLHRAIRHPLWAPLNDAATWDRIAAPFNPAWSFTESRARVERVVDETADVRSLWLAPNRRFTGFRPGQHVLLELEIDGARHGRCFSISSAPRSDGLLRLTIKRKADGPVSHAAHALTRGKVVRLSQAQGDFAPRAAAGKLLLLSAGSGVTPMMAWLQALAGSGRDVVLLHTDREAADTIFAAELRELALRWPHLRLHLHATRTAGRLDTTRVADCVPDWTERETLLCGPDGFMQAVETMYENAGLGAQLHSESFGRRAAPIDPHAPAHVVSRGDATFTARSGQTLLDAAESAGLQPRFGCRRGICRTCQCRKRSGTVRNTLTGLTSGPGDELIQLCISTPLGAVELAPQ
jgi:ferredoxin-NADP reductase